MDILYGIVIAYAVISVVFTTIFFIGLIRNIRREINLVKEVKHIRQTIKLVYTEQIGDVYYLYDQLNNHFIAQGATEEEMWRTAKLRFPNKEFIIQTTNGNAAVVNVTVESK